MTETTDNFIPYLHFVINVNILLVICIGVRGVVVPNVAYVVSHPSKCKYIFFIIIITVRFQH